jgi:8-oxo-dGTP diphosphatase
MYPVRTSTKAVIIENNALLVIMGISETGEAYCCLPGGGQEKFETLESTLKRECLEEIGAKVIVGDILFVRDYISRNNPEFATSDIDLHQVDMFFECSLEAGETPKNGANPDRIQQGLRWLPLSELENANLYPEKLKTLLLTRDRVYFGDQN